MTAPFSNASLTSFVLLLRPYMVSRMVTRADGCIDLHIRTLKTLDCEEKANYKPETNQKPAQTVGGGYV